MVTNMVDQAALNLSYCKISAPADGIIGNRTVQVGQQLQPGQEMFAITETSDMWVTANFKETQIRNMHPGQSATIHVVNAGWKSNRTMATDLQTLAHRHRRHARHFHGGNGYHDC